MKDYADYFKGRDWVHQLGFFAPDWKAFMQRHHELFGSGPFYYTTNTFGKLIYRGDEVDCSGLEFHACYGAWGSHSIEVVQPDPFDVPTMYSDMNDPDTPGFNHLHIFVEDLEEAWDACEFLSIPVVTVGYGDVANAKEKAAQTGVSMEEIERNASRPSFMVVDLRRDFGMMAQLIGPNAKIIHDLVLKAGKDWDGETDLFRPLGGK